MRSLIFDAGPIISLATNNLLGMLKPLKKRFKGAFMIPESVKREVIEHPLLSKRFEFEALEVMALVSSGILTVYSGMDIKERSEKLLSLANHTFKARNKWLTLVHPAEIDAISLAIKMGSDAVAIDERTTRWMVEKPEAMWKRLESRLHTDVSFNRERASRFQEMCRNIRIIRSAELGAVAFEIKGLDSYLPAEKVNGRTPEEVLIDAVLWGIKIQGCAISSSEIEELKKLVLSGNNGA